MIDRQPRNKGGIMTQLHTPGHSSRTRLQLSRPWHTQALQIHNSWLKFKHLQQYIDSQLEIGEKLLNIVSAYKGKCCIWLNL